MWGLIWLAYAFAQSRMTKLVRWTKPLPPSPPRVTIVIPAKDEGLEVERCLKSVLAQDYPDFDIVAVNDRSRDQTGAIFDTYSMENERFRSLHIPMNGLPPGWLGKCNALYTATRQIDSPWILFVDSDVTLAPNALSSAMSLALVREVDALSILTTLECRNFLERLMLPLLAGTWTVMHAVSLTNQDSKPHRAEANGQFFLVRREAYEAVGGHATVKDCITEDVELARALKVAEFKMRFYMGAHLAATRMHARFDQMLHGWSRIYSGTARRRPWRILATIIAVIICVDSFWPALVLGPLHPLRGSLLLTLGVLMIHWTAATLFLRNFYRKSGNAGWYALLAPLSTSLMLVILLYSLRKCQTGKIVWRDTVFHSKTERV